MSEAGNELTFNDENETEAVQEMDIQNDFTQRSNHLLRTIQEQIDVEITEVVNAGGDGGQYAMDIGGDLTAMLVYRVVRGTMAGYPNEDETKLREFTIQTLVNRCNNSLDLFNEAFASINPDVSDGEVVAAEE